MNTITSAVSATAVTATATATRTERASGHFNSATLALLWRNGVLIKSIGPSCTWHDDGCFEQKITGPDGVRFKVVNYDVERESASEICGAGIIVSRRQMKEACAREGCVYEFREI